MNFKLHERLADETVSIFTLRLCQILLRNDSNYPWIILVPQRPGIIEIFDLSHQDRSLLIEEINQAAMIMQATFSADKLNIAALGNQVPQLHIHIIARYQNDLAWPQPVWGFSPAVAYAADELALRIKQLKQAVAAVF